ncbi:Sugar transporter [[Actinomadura] parvosata subsp. kistnae]|nr:Sugar transporter [Actinomadura parvosata subsp. kistnae]
MAAVLIGQTAVPALIIFASALITLRYRLTPPGAPASPSSG